MVGADSPHTSLDAFERTRETLHLREQQGSPSSPPFTMNGGPSGSSPKTYGNPSVTVDVYPPSLDCQAKVSWEIARPPDGQTYLPEVARAVATELACRRLGEK